MGIEFQGDPPYDLPPAQTAEARAVDETVELDSARNCARQTAFARSHSSADDSGGCQGAIWSDGRGGNGCGNAGAETGRLVMSKYTFKQFQAEYPNDAACLAKLMEINYGGTEITCPACGVRARQVSSHDQAARVRLSGVRPSHLSGRWHDISQVAHPAHQMVFRDVPHDQHPPRRSCEGNRAADWRHLQVRLAHVP